MGKPLFKKSSISDSLKEKTEKLDLLLQKLAEKGNEGAVILVEGMNDVKALRSIGITGKIQCIKNRRTPLYDILSEYVNMGEELIVLTDFDRRGTQLAGKIVNFIEKHGKTVNLTFWMKMRGFLSNDIKDVEGLPSYIKNIKRKFDKNLMLES